MDQDSTNGAQTDASPPSYKGLHPASDSASRVKQRNRRIDTKQEILLRRELWRMGLRYLKHADRLPGKPDLAFRGARIAVFCDGDFWHGRNWEIRKAKLTAGTNAGYWVAKIASNIARDARTTKALEEDGWQVMRLWESDIKRDPVAAARCVFDAVVTRRGSAKLS